MDRSGEREFKKISTQGMHLESDLQEHHPATSTQKHYHVQLRFSRRRRQRWEAVDGSFMIRLFHLLNQKSSMLPLITV